MTPQAEQLMTLVQLAPAWSEELRAEIEAQIKAFNAKEPVATVVGDVVVRLTDVGNSLRFKQLHQDKARYCAKMGVWFVWAGTHWQEDNTKRADLMAKEVVRSIFAEADGDYEKSQELTKTQNETEATKAQNSGKQKRAWAFKSESSRGISAMLRLAESELPVTPDQLDAGKFVFNCANGTIDLCSMDFAPHRQSDLLTKLSAVTYDPVAACPDFEKALKSIFPEDPLVDDAPGDLEMIAFIRRLFGYCLCGDTSEQIVAILHGDGSNGKSVLLETICAVLGPYASPAPEGLLLARRGEQHPTELADLFGKRLVHSVETGEGARLDEARVKKLTGGDKLKARKMREDFWEFDPTHKLLILTNHRPRIRGTDHAIWRRVLLIPFTAKFWDPDKDPKPGELRDQPRFQKDKNLIANKFAHERSGILNWLLDGFRDWQQGGLLPPKSVQAAAEEYEKSEDLVGQWVEECCAIYGDPNAKTKSGEAYKRFLVWCEANGEHPRTSQKAFTQRICAITGFEVDRSHGVRFLPGIIASDMSDVAGPESGTQSGTQSGTRDSDTDDYETLFK